jgi:hypothetical protein
VVYVITLRNKYTGVVTRLGLTYEDYEEAKIAAKEVCDRCNDISVDRIHPSDVIQRRR